jgi:hypothetical protein
VDSLVEALALDAEMLSGACLIEHYEAWLADVVHPAGKRSLQAAARIAALEAENARSVEEMSEDDIAELLAKECAPYATRKASTGLSAWCIAKGVNRAHANEFVNRKRGPQADLLSALGIRCFFARALLERQTDG